MRIPYEVLEADVFFDAHLYHVDSLEFSVWHVYYIDVQRRLHPADVQSVLDDNNRAVIVRTRFIHGPMANLSLHVRTILCSTLRD